MLRVDKDHFGITVDHQKVVLDIDLPHRTVRGYTNITAYPQSGTVRLARLHCRHQVRITAVNVNGVNAEFRHTDAYENLRQRVAREYDTISGHRELSRGLQTARKEADEGELTIVIPDGVDLVPIDNPTDATAEISGTSSALAADSPKFNSILIHVAFELVTPDLGLVFQLPTSQRPDALPVLYTQSEMVPGQARLWLPCIDDPAVRCTWELIYIIARRPVLTVPTTDTMDLDEPTHLPDPVAAAADLPDLTVVSSGELVQQTSHPTDPSKRVFVYSLHAASPACSLAFVVAPFRAVRIDASCFTAVPEAPSPPTSGDGGDAAAQEGEDGKAINVGGGDGINLDPTAVPTTDNPTLPTSTEDGQSGDFKPDDGDDDDDDDQRFDMDDDDDDDEIEAADADRMAVDSAPAASPSRARKADGKPAKGAGATRGDKVGGIYVFAAPHYYDELVNTCRVLPAIVDFYCREYGSYPFSTYKAVFLDELYRPVVPGASLTLFRSDLLHPADVIEQTYETRRVLSQAVAEQWFGQYVTPRAWSDLWLVSGLASHLASRFLKHHLGTNEYLFRLKRDIDRLCDLDVNQLPLGSAELAPPFQPDSLAFLQFKAPLVLYILDKRMMKGGLSLGLHRVIPKVLIAAMSGDLGPAGALHTTLFLKMCRKVSGFDVKTFAEQWIYGSGCPIFYFSYQFNRKKLVVEINMRQESTNGLAPSSDAPYNRGYPSGPPSALATPLPHTPGLGDRRLGAYHPPTAPPAPTFTGQMTARVREADGTPYEHVLDIERGSRRFEVQFNTKYKRIRRSTKRFQMRQAAAAAEEANVNSLIGLDTEETEEQLALFGGDNEEEKRTWRIVEWGEEDEESLASSTFEWIRLDSDLEWLGRIHFEQPDFMWAAQLQKDRDVVAQYEAIRALRGLPSKAASTSLMRVVMDVRVFYRIRMEAARALPALALPSLDYVGLYHLRRIFERRYCLALAPGDPSPSSVTANTPSDARILPQPNYFANMSEYFVQKALVLAMAAARDADQRAFPEVRQFLLTLVQFNDNSDNEYTDGYYLATLLTALADTITPPGEDDPDLPPPPPVADDPDVRRVVDEVERFRVIDALLSTYHNTVTLACLRAIDRLVRCRVLPFNRALFLHMTRFGNFLAVRQCALDILLTHYGLQPHDALAQYYIRLVAADPDLAFRRYTASRLVRALFEDLQRLARPAGPALEDFRIHEDGGPPAGYSEPAEDTTQLVVQATDALRHRFEGDRTLASMLWSLLSGTVATLDPYLQADLLVLSDLLYRPLDPVPAVIVAPPPPPIHSAVAIPPTPATVPKLKFKVAASGNGASGVNSPVDRRSSPAPTFAVATPPPPPSIPVAPVIIPAPVVATPRPAFHKTPRPVEAPKQPDSTPTVPKAKSVLRIKRERSTGRSPERSPKVVTPTPAPAPAPTLASSPPQPPPPAFATSPPAAPIAPISTPSAPVIRLKYRPTPTSSTTPSAAPSPGPSSASTPVHRPTPAVPAPATPPALPAPPPPPPQPRAKPATPTAAATPVPTPTASLTSDDKKRLRRLLRKVMANPHAYLFLQPVDPVRDGCPTYLNVIRHPMDLGTMKTKLERGQYRTLAAFHDDFHTMIENCYTFNPIGTYVYTECQELESAFEEVWTESFGETDPQPQQNYTIAETPRDSRSVATSPDRGSAPRPRKHSTTTSSATSPSLRSVDRALVAASASATGTPTPGSPGLPPDNQVRQLPYHAKHPLKLIRKLQAHPSAAPFLQPVDPIALGIPHYTKIVRHPMDLSTIERKLLKPGVYKDYVAVRADVDLMLSNCFVFNPPGNPVHDTGRALETFFSKLWNSLVTTLMARHSSQSAAGSTPTSGTARTPRPESIAPSGGGPSTPTPSTGSASHKREPSTPTTPSASLTTQDRNRLTTLLRKLRGHRAAPIFLQPVDPVRDGCPTYYDVIRSPMDLGTIGTKLKRNAYATPAAFRADVDLMLRNCFKFNPPGTYAYEQGKLLEDAFTKTWPKHWA
ncbi:hypothetical protein IWQ60_008893 [Tieghemiomyces parasiticus]|uniref:Transcription initiation factor TFIID subunit 2 n=1 Tax=Tieghemiomyces parasiticus TaxID=78921 RepID=A0A9W8DKT5_9FUNG|nr:hypothetical protein IWQ60_008893 [Tieghemiomyces parasiticus]